MKPKIPKEEFYERISRAQQLMKIQNIDLLFAFGNEMEPQYQKYFSDFWPSFETAAVIMGQDGSPVLLVGPESKKRALEQQVIKDVRSMEAFRESSSPGYTGMHLDAFCDVIDDVINDLPLKTAAIAGARLLPFDIYNEFKKNLERYGSVEIKNDRIVDQLRAVKSENEIACIRYACTISSKTMQYLAGHIHAGMTELQVKGMALDKMYELGAEGEAYPMWVLSGDGSDNAIGRARQKKIQNDDLLQLQIGARYEGYASTIARPVIIGNPEHWVIDAITSLYEGYDSIMSELYAGNHAGQAARRFYHTMENNGYSDWLVYGPCHGLGIVECEAPWVEKESDYKLLRNMTFGVDLYIENKSKKRGLRVEDTICVTESGPLNMTDFPREILTL